MKEHDNYFLGTWHHANGRSWVNVSQTKSVLNAIRWILNFAKHVSQILNVKHFFFLTLGLAFVLSSYFGLGQFSVTGFVFW